MAEAEQISQLKEQLQEQQGRIKKLERERSKWWSIALIGLISFYFFSIWFLNRLPVDPKTGLDANGKRRIFCDYLNLESCDDWKTKLERLL